ncbi:37687_t:CDS:1, partial [Gigaspora margarita]
YCVTSITLLVLCYDVVITSAIGLLVPLFYWCYHYWCSFANATVTIIIIS